LKAKRKLSIDDLDFGKANGLIPIIVQDYGTLKVLTLAYANREALEKTLQTGYAHYFRRSLGRVMKKGKTSGNVQEVKEILIDCDGDTAIFLVKPVGPACHTGEETCFHNGLKENLKRGNK